MGALKKTMALRVKAVRTVVGALKKTMALRVKAVRTVVGALKKTMALRVNAVRTVVLGPRAGTAPVQQRRRALLPVKAEA
jgi:prolyl-tRNA editing enzyme YbaK/EbsC (Cys-tRNA(Pro) deacylase)